MANPSTPEESGRLVLQIYARFDSQPGQVLRANNFVAVAARRRIPIADIQRGLEYAAEMGWIEETEDGSLRLTEQGFTAMPQPERSY
jgi:hypothetical protein